MTKQYSHICLYGVWTKRDRHVCVGSCLYFSELNKTGIFVVVLREEWLNTKTPILESKTPKSYFHTPSNRARLMQVVLEMKFGEMA
jgi:hypothetical protein